MRKHLILLVDDDPDHALLAREAIESVHGGAIDIVHASDGPAALELLTPADRLPNLILLDINMPGLDGFEVLRRIKGDERLRVIPVVMLTSSNDERDVARSYGLGSNSYVQKPVGNDDLYRCVSSIPAYWFGLNVPPPEGAQS